MEVVAVLTVFILAGLVNMLVGTLAIYHTYCLIKGQTTIEGSERTKTRRLIRRRKIDKVNETKPSSIRLIQYACLG